MSVEELNKEQLTELKQNYYCNVVKENEGVSYWELADVDNLVSDKEIKEYYSNTDFSSDDFSIESNDGYDYYKEKNYTKEQQENYYNYINDIVCDIDKLIQDKMLYHEYDTDDLANIIIGLILNHEYSSKDTIDSLICDLEKIKNKDE